MEMLAFSQRGDDMQPELGDSAADHQLDGGGLRAAILDLAAGSGSTQDVLQGYIAGAAPAAEAATSVHAALREAGTDASREAVEAALREISHELVAPALEAPTAAPMSPEGDAAADDREAAKVLYRLYAKRGRVKLRADGHVYAGKPGGLSDADREALRKHGEALKHLLSDEAISELWPRAVSHVLDTAQRHGYTSGTAEYERASELIGKAQNAYEQNDNGLCRYRLQQAVRAAAGRLPEAG